MEKGRRRAIAGIASLVASPWQIVRAATSTQALSPTYLDEFGCEKGMAHITTLSEPGDKRLPSALSDPTPRSYRFVRPALAIELDADWVEYHQGYLSGPRCVSGPVVRKYVHEVLHFWQALSQGFITNLALEELDLIETFRKTGVADGHAALQDSFASRPANAPFSPWELSEALCRYWDIHILGPERILHDMVDGTAWVEESFRPYTLAQFDRVMTMEDNWAAPYRWAIRQWGSSVSVLAFPLLAFFALQTRCPIEVFMSAGDALHTHLYPFQGSIHTNWPLIYKPVKEQCQIECMRLTGSLLTPGWDVIQRNRLGRSAVWGRYKVLLKLLRQVGPDPDEMEREFALPGEPKHRESLLNSFVPAVTLFRNGRWLGDSTFGAWSEAGLLNSNGPGAVAFRKLYLNATDVARESEALVDDYRRMRIAATLARFGLPQASAR